MKWLMILTMLPFAALAGAQTSQPTELPNILVMKFEQVDQTPGFAWLSRSIQQSLVTDINHSRFARGQTLPEARSAPTTDTTVALNLAREQRATFVIVGGFQAWEDALRITAQVIEVQNGAVVGSLKSTGAMNGLFLMQDGLISQLRAMISPNATRFTAVPAEMLVIPTSEAIAVAGKMNRFEVIAPQPWEGSARNRYQFQPGFDGGYGYGGYGCWGGSVWRGIGIWGFPYCW